MHGVPGRARRRHRRAVLRPVVGPAPVAAARRRSAPASGCVPTGRSCSTSARRSSAGPPTSRSSSCDWIQAVRTSDDPRLQGHRHPGAAAPRAARRVARTSTCPATATSRSGARIRSMPRSKDDYFDSMYYSAAVVGLNTSAFIEAAVVGKPVHTVLLPEISTHNQEGTLHFHYLLNVNGGLLRVARIARRARVAAGRVARRRGRRRSKGGAVRRRRSSVRSAPTSPATPRFVDAVERVRRAGAAAGAALARGSWLLRLPLYPARGRHLALQLRTQLWRKHTRNRLRKEYKRASGDAAHRHEAVRGASAARPRTPEHRRHRRRGRADAEARPPARSGQDAGRAGTSKRRARSASWSPCSAAAARRSSSGPWLSETGFELLYWIPFLAWAKAYGNFDPERLVVVSRGGARAVVQPHHAATTRTSSASSRPTSSGAGTKSGSPRSTGGRSTSSVSSFDREIIDRVSEKRGLQGAEAAAPVRDVPAVRALLVPAAPVTLIEAFTAVRGDPAVAATGRARAAARALRRRQVLRQHGAAATRRRTAPSSPRSSPIWRSTSTSCCSTPADRFDDHDDFPPEPAGRVHSIEHLMTPGEQPGGADRGDSATPRRSSAPTAASRTWRRCSA